MDTAFIVLLNGLAFSGLLFLLSSGLTLVLGLARVVNFAHGSIYILSGYLFILIAKMTGNWWLALLVGPVLVALIGGLIEYFLIRPIYGKPILLQLLVTFGLVLIIEDAIKFFWGSVPYGLNQAPAFTTGSFTLSGIDFPMDSLVTTTAAAVVALFLWLWLNKTRMGKQINAASSDMEMAKALGINVSLVYTMVFVIGSFCAGLGGGLLTLKVALLPSLGLEYLIYAIAVVIIGGMGSFKGSVLGALIVGVCYSFGVLLVPNFAMVSVFALLFIALLIRPRGLFGQVEEIRGPAVTTVGTVRFDLPAVFGGRISGQSFSWAVVIILLLALIGLPFFAPGFWVLFTIEVLILMVLATSLNLLMRAGMLSLAHGAFFGAGAYTASLILIHATESIVLALSGAVFMSAALALVIGLLSLRHVELYFKLFTLAFAQFFYTVVFKWSKLTGGDDGLMGIPLPSLTFLGLTEAVFRPDSEAKFLYLVMGISGASLAALLMVIRSPFGQILLAIRENSERVSFLGINPNVYKLAAFIIAGAMAGLAGAIFAPFQMVISPIAAHWTKSADPLFMNIIGGVNSFIGPSIGAIVYIFLKDWLSSMMEYWRLWFGAMLIIVAFVFPNGLVASAESALVKFQRSRGAGAAEESRSGVLSRPAG